jgi:hypothetical protein
VANNPFSLGNTDIQIAGKTEDLRGAGDVSVGGNEWESHSGCSNKVGEMHLEIILRLEVIL